MKATKVTEKNGAGFLRDVVKWMDNRKETFNENKTAKQLLNEFCFNTLPDPNHYSDTGNDFIG